MINLKTGVDVPAMIVRGRHHDHTALCHREGAWWVITVPELESGRVTQARSLDEVPATVANLVATMTGTDPAMVEVT